jgi:3-hydroxyisobutyrate dehydrogenase-like beta-hydroxyacid dehydrogenase
MSVAILGLGIIGSLWARNLQADGLEVRTWNRTPKAFPGFVSDAAQAASGADFIIIVVADPAAVQQVLQAIAPMLKSGQTVIQCSTISKSWTLEFAETVRKTGARFLEAPFTGSKVAAENRKTVFYLGGESEDIENARPILQKIAAHLLPIGPVGSASVLKLAMNMNMAMVMQALSESLHFARSQGLSDAAFFDGLQLNGSRSGLSDIKQPALRNRVFSPQFSLKHMDKDLRLALEDAGDARLPQLQTLKTIYEEGMSKGLGESDFSVLVELI